MFAPEINRIISVKKG